MHTRKRAGAKRASIRMVIDDDDDEITDAGGQNEENESSFDERAQDKKLVAVDEDISKLETPTFTTLERGPPEPLHQNKKLRWDHKVNLIGEKVINPRIHCCEKCSLPILIYGRMIPCKHVFCYDCARKTEKICPRCNDKVSRVEQSALGTVFMCTFGTTRHGTVGCRRTYLSQRDLQAHINHRHIRPATIPSTTTTATATHSAPVTHNTTAPPVSVPTNTAHPPPPHPRDPRHVGLVGMESSSHTPPAPHPQPTHTLPPATHIHPHVQQEFREAPDTSRPPPGIPPVSVSIGGAAPPSRYSHPATTAAYLHNSYPSPIPVVSTRSNLITVPIQDDNAAPSNQHVHVQPHQPPPQYPAPSPVGPPHQPPPIQPQHPPGPNPYPPVPHHYQHPPPNAPQPAYSQAPPPPAYGSPPVNTQSFAQTHPPHVPPPPVHNPAPPVYSAPAPPLHHPPPTTYSSPNVNTHTLPPPPQRFPPSSPYDESTYSQPWGAGNVPPPAPAHGPLPPRPMTNPPGAGMGMPQPCAPTEQGYRPPYYQ